MHHKSKILISVHLLLLTTGCGDKTVTQIAREAADRQAQQNTVMARLNQEVATGTKRLVEADAQARKEIIGVHHELQSERTRLDTSKDVLEQERRQIAGQRRTESALVWVCGVLLVIVVVGFCWYALVGARCGDGAEAQLNELLVQELLTDSPPLLFDVRQVPAAIAELPPGTPAE